jgi:hypothetical protein
VSDLRDHVVSYASLYTEDQKKKFLELIKPLDGARRTRELHHLIFNVFMAGYNLADEAEKMKKVHPRFEDQ